MLMLCVCWVLLAHIMYLKPCLFLLSNFFPKTFYEVAVVMNKLELCKELKLKGTLKGVQALYQFLIVCLC